MVEELMSGALIVLEIRAQNAVTVFRDFCGPADPVGPNFVILIFPPSLCFTTFRKSLAIYAQELSELFMVKTK